MPQKNEERLQKYLAECGVASRRKSEELIAAGKVKVNGHVAQIGDKIDPRRDLVTVRGKKVRKTQRNYYILLHKPRGYVTTVSDELGRKTVMDLEGIDLDGRMTAPCDVTVLTAEENRTVLEFVLHEGRNRQIRRMCEAVDLEVIRLKRIAVGSLKLGMLPVGKWRELTDNEVQKLMRSGALQTEDTKK